MSVQIEGLTAIVTGGASGLGAAAASMLSAEGAKVIILDRDHEAGDAHARTIGGRCVTTDVTDEEAVAKALVQAESAFGTARILVNCAGVAPSIKTVGRDGSPHKLPDFRRAIEINLVGTFNVLSQFAARLTPESRTPRMSFSGMPQRPNPPATMVIPSDKTPSRAA